MIQAIETRYNGYRFRSRLEARWAVFFDALNARWEYETQGYRLSNGTMYLPDFYFPGQYTFVETKGESPNLVELKKARGLVQDFQSGLIFVVSRPPGEERIWQIMCRPSLTERKWAGKDSIRCWALFFGKETKKIEAAYQVARSARFEHGETPRSGSP